MAVVGVGESPDTAGRAGRLQGDHTAHVPYSLPSEGRFCRTAGRSEEEKKNAGEEKSLENRPRKKLFCFIFFNPWRGQVKKKNQGYVLKFPQRAIVKPVSRSHWNCVSSWGEVESSAFQEGRADACRSLLGSWFPNVPLASDKAIF